MAEQCVGACTCTKTDTDTDSVADANTNVSSTSNNVAGATRSKSSRVQIFEGEWDQEGVYFYQAFSDAIADYAVENQRFGGPDFQPDRMTWIKPSFAWVLYRSGYAAKHKQTRILKVKLSHRAVAEILSRCTCIEAGFRGAGTKGACVDGRVQWDPARDIATADSKKKVPRKMMSKRAIQIGVRRELSAFCVESALHIKDVTTLARSVGLAHRAKKIRIAQDMMEKLQPQLPTERPYLPACPDRVLRRLGMLPGPEADVLAQLGRGMVSKSPVAVCPPPTSVIRLMEVDNSCSATHEGEPATAGKSPVEHDEAAK
eukprot:INCI1004.1.p1 GENE.INCI1004.1~~INCI1004.1.p1  ORF type:complete len:315 (-),score=60.83 INCI1004.1:199-1143(-)